MDDHSSVDFNAAIARARADHQAACTAIDETIVELEQQAKLTVVQMRPRDGIVAPADRIVLRCLRDLQAIPEADRQGADILIDYISLAYQAAARDVEEGRRRCWAMLRISAEQGI